ncbi:type II secretion system protein [Mesorhizobium sp.]|uniref:type IV pilus modification PilV family protein n=1 Tax=Mesorhizobium sp. TaxID=1871066 RepID=UPI0025FCF85E|nr:type II secretion system protein [Mesorhizobium sp.]
MTCRRKTDQHSSEDGFTLIETLVAFMILAISLTVFTQSINQATTQIRTGEVSAEAALIAERVAAVPGDSEGTDKGYFWRRTAETFERSDQNGKLVPFVLVTVEIRRAPAAAPIFVLRNAVLGGPPE